MTDVSIHAEKLTAGVQSGATIGHFLSAAQPHGLATSTGGISIVGLAGLTLFGGYGRLLGKFGLASDNLLSAQVVTADGALLTASETENPDLYWGLRGAGGNFGVVVTMEYRLHPVSEVLSGLLLFPLEQAADVLRRFDDFAASAPDELTIQSGIIQTPDGKAMLFLSPTYCGPIAEGEKLVDTMRKFGKPVTDQIQAVPYGTLVRSMDELAPAGRDYFIQTRSIARFSAETIELWIEQARQFSSPYSMLSAHHFHGAASRVAPSDTAFGLRRNHFMLEIIAAWEHQTRDDDRRHVEWAQKASRALAPHAMQGGYVNLLDETENERVPLAFGANYERLTRVKRTYDPDDVFGATIGHVSPQVS